MIEKNRYELADRIAAANRYDESPIASGPHMFGGTVPVTVNQEI